MDLLVQLNEAGKQFSLKLSTSACDDQMKSFVVRIGLLVRALCAKRIIGVGEPHSMGVWGNLITRKTVRITGPIPPLMMMPAKVVGIAEGWVFDDCRNGGQNAAALDGVCFHQFKFFGGELRGFV